MTASPKLEGNSDMTDEGVEQPESVVDHSKLPPEEGFQGWLCVVGAFICLFCSFGFLNA